MMVGALVKALMLVRSDDVNSSKSNSRNDAVWVYVSARRRE